jgi:hypothetical protein
VKEKEKYHTLPRMTQDQTAPVLQIAKVKKAILKGILF